MGRRSWRVTVATAGLVLALSSLAWAAPPGAGQGGGNASYASGDHGAGSSGNAGSNASGSGGGSYGPSGGQGMSGTPGNGGSGQGGSGTAPSGGQGMSGAPGNGGSGQGGSGTGPSGGQGMSGTPGNGGSGQGGQGALGAGRAVSAAIQAALAGGAGGTAVANAIHQVVLTEKPNAQGLTVAMAVYQGLTVGGSVYRSTSGGSGGSSLAFTDLSQASWANGAVGALKQAGVVDGTAPGQFSPNLPVTQAELTTMLARLQAGSTTTTSGVPSGTPSWAQGAMAWAQGNGVLSGVQGLGAPNAPLTRAQAVLMLLNAAGLGPVAATQSNATIQLSGNVPTWAHGAVALAVQLGLLQGSGGQVLANQPLTRAQMAVLLARLAVLETQSTASGG